MQYAAMLRPNEFRDFPMAHTFKGLQRKSRPGQSGPENLGSATQPRLDTMVFFEEDLWWNSTLNTRRGKKNTATEVENTGGIASPSHTWHLEHPWIMLCNTSTLETLRSHWAFGTLGGVGEDNDPYPTAWTPAVCANNIHMNQLDWVVSLITTQLKMDYSPKDGVKKL